LTDRLFNAYQVANLLGVTPGEVVQWAQKGLLPLKRIGDGSVRITENALVEFLERMGLDIKAIFSKISAEEEKFQQTGNTESQSLSDSESSPASTSAVIFPSQPEQIPQTSESVSQADIAEPLDESADVLEVEQTPPPSAPQQDTEGDLALPVEVAEMPSSSPADRACQVVEAILDDAVGSGAESIIFDIRPQSARLKLRINGVVRGKPNFARNLPIDLIDPLAVHLRKLAGLEVNKVGMGEFSTQVGGRKVYFETSVMPVVGGERIVFHRATPLGELRLDQLGLATGDEVILRRILDGNSGLVLLAGPFGSGRSTTLGAMIAQQLKWRDVVVVSRPGKYSDECLTVVEVRDNKDFSLAQTIDLLSAQRSDVIAVDEICDRSALRSALEASRAGGMVLAKIAVCGLAETLEQVLQTGMERWVLSMALSAIVVQRMVRRLCPQCRRLVDSSDSRIDMAGLSQAEVYGPAGCPACQETGYMDRQRVFSVVEVADLTAEALRNGSDAAAVQRAAIEAGAKTLFHVGLDLVRAGVTCLDQLQYLGGNILR